MQFFKSKESIGIFYAIFAYLCFALLDTIQKTLIVYLFSIIIFIIFVYTLRDMEIEYAIRTTMDRLVMTASGFFIYPSIKLLTNRLFKFSP